eukprot:Plantae.Rhodophyta-Rhodochaete_pulchella.ctg24974.p1 GENE.Plantae.Rhodophyta-Rhodochaete_pulchella.ctg24974~~Plantae.Rhodophyta-Rhodochaete_pulchella.ctg24974.p1  ORF type:complete len:357 (+),score=39.89 Plantae.Rhodophyta-Rhodochaete_pulchella.ctg24974:58-1071(+)
MSSSMEKKSRRNRHSAGPLHGIRSAGSLIAVVAGSAAAPVLTFQEKLISGSIARGIAQTVLHPVDVVRTRLQAKDIKANWHPSVFLKGVAPQILLAIPAGGTQFVAFEFAKSRLSELDKENKYRSVRDLLAGAASSVAAATFRVPQEVIKQGIQADLYPNAAVAVSQIAKNAGLGGFYKGTLVTMSRDVPWNALSFLFHAQAKRVFTSLNSREPSNRENLGLAGLAGALAAVIMTPVDVVKTRLMTQRAGVAQYTGIAATLKKILAEEGPRTLIKGVVPRILFLAPLAGITFSVYEAMVKVMLRRRASRAKLAARSPRRIRDSQACRGVALVRTRLA